MEDNGDKVVVHKKRALKKEKIQKRYCAHLVVTFHDNL